jgi:osmoprotectant transport system ATP-binding protein
VISLKNISKNFGPKKILDDLSIHVSKGETLALIGLSGSGKTTALKIICGLHLPDNGSVLINQIPLNQENLPLIRRSLGYVIQDGGLFPHLTARANILLIGSEAGLNQDEIQKKIDELCRMTKILPELLEKYPRELSGGQRQRIGIMRALFLDPEILLLDEPMASLDPITRKELQNELKILFKRLNKTVVLVTHDLYEASFFADKILLLHQGKIAQQGSMNELLEKPANSFVRDFVNAQNQSFRGNKL